MTNIVESMNDNHEKMFDGNMKKIIMIGDLDK
jgi:hypothetical protein